MTLVFSGPTACCEGIEQVNVQLPDFLAGAGRVAVVLTVNGQTSNTVQVVMLPPTGAGPFASDEDHGNRSRELSSLAYIPNTSLALSADENDGVVRVIDISLKKVTQVITLRDGAAPSAVAVDSTGNIAVGRGERSRESGGSQSHRSHEGGSSAALVYNSNVYFAYQAGGSVSVLAVNTTTPIITIKVDLGARALAVDVKDNLLVVSNEGSGTLAVVDLNTIN